MLLKEKIAKNRFLCFMIAFFMLSVLFLFSFAFSGAWFSDTESESLSFDFPHVTLGECENSSDENAVVFVASSSFDVTLNNTILTNIALAIRVRTVPIWIVNSTGLEYDGILPANFVVTCGDGWSEGNSGEFYLDSPIESGSVAREINLILTIDFGNSDESYDYEDYSVKIEAQFEYHQVDFVSEDFHLWKNSAPQGWLENNIRGEA